jgi:hypothetical protein
VAESTSVKKHFEHVILLLQNPLRVGQARVELLPEGELEELVVRRPVEPLAEAVGEGA